MTIRYLYKNTVHEMNIDLFTEDFVTVIKRNERKKVIPRDQSVRILSCLRTLFDLLFGGFYYCFFVCVFLRVFLFFVFLFYKKKITMILKAKER